MRYEDFKEAFTAEMTFLMDGSGVTITPEQIPKVNQNLDALSFRREGDHIGTLLYLNDIYEQHEQGAGIAELAEQARGIVGDRMNQMPELPLIDHDFIAENVYLTVMNADRNRDYLSGIPHEMLEDIAVVPRVKINEEASFVLRNDMMGSYGFTSQELLKTAHANMEQMEFRCNDLSSVLFGFGMPGMPEPGPSTGIYVLTNASGIDGAGAILSENAMKSAREMIGEDFFSLPSSRHEVLLAPRSMEMSVGELTNMVRDVNRAVVDEKDFLSDHIYRYNSRSGAIKMLEPQAEVPEKKQSLPPILM